MRSRTKAMPPPTNDTSAANRTNPPTHQVEGPRPLVSTMIASTNGSVTRKPRPWSSQSIGPNGRPKRRATMRNSQVTTPSTTMDRPSPTNTTISAILQPPPSPSASDPPRHRPRRTGLHALYADLASGLHPAYSDTVPRLRLVLATLLALA